jgi:predicted negative regulator of RcsB-dependent stress response
VAKDKTKPKSPASSGAKPTFDPKPVRVEEEALLERLKPHAKKMAVILAAGIVILLVVMVVVYFKDRGQEGRTAKLAAVLDVASVPVDPAAAKAKDDKRMGPKPYASDTERANAVLDAMAKQGGDLAPTYRATALVDAGKIDEAIEEYKEDEHAAGLNGVLAREGLGLALEARADQHKGDAAARQKDLEAALAEFKAMQPLDNGPRRAYALYHQGRVLEELGKKADAKAAFDKAKELGKDTELPQLIDERLARLGA